LRQQPRASAGAHRDNRLRLALDAPAAKNAIVFRLVRFYVVTSLIAVLAIGLLLFFHRQGEVQRLIGIAESQNITLGRAFANEIWPRIASYVGTASSLSETELRTRPETREIGQALRAVTTGLPVLKVKVYDLHGLTVYSSDLTQIGEDKSNNPGYFSAATKGIPASKLSFRDTFSAFSGELQNLDLVESYLPIRRGDGPVEAVFELYTDVTELMAAIKRDTTRLVSAFALVVLLLYGMLSLIVRRADRTIKQQYVAIMDKNTALQREISERRQAQEALRKARDDLELRVQERTRELSDEVAERRQAEERLRKLSWAVEQSPAMTVITNAEGSIEYVNPQFTEVTGYTLSDMNGKSAWGADAPGTPAPEHQELWNAISGGREWHGELRNQRKDGSHYWAATTVSPITNTDGAITHFLLISEDITAHKQAEEDARRHRDVLAHLDRVSLMGEMATSLAHELNQPLTVISGSAQLALNKLKSGNTAPEELAHTLEQTNDQAKRANEIIRRVRSFVQQGGHERQRIDVNGPIRGVVDLLRSDALRHYTTIKLDLDDELPHVMADPIEIQQVVVNLALNGMEAMEHGRSMARVLTISSRRNKEGAVEIAVRNTGDAIPSEELEKMFAPFFTTKATGLGMGLTISRSLVEAHGGKLWATSDRDEGTVFCFTLPAANQEQPV
jgi:two-component system sensor kinase FixL